MIKCGGISKIPPHFITTFYFPSSSWLRCSFPFHPIAEMGVLITLEKTNNPNPFPSGNKFGLYWLGADGGT